MVRLWRVCSVPDRHRKITGRKVSKKTRNRISSDILLGQTPQNERQNIISTLSGPGKRFKDIFISNPHTGGRGITLTEAKVLIFYSNSYDLELRTQAEDRIHRIGQNHSCTYIDLVSKNTVDENNT